MIEVSSYHQERVAVPLLDDEAPMILMYGRKDELETYRFPTWKSAMAYIEELLEKGRCVISAIQEGELT